MKYGVLVTLVVLIVLLPVLLILFAGRMSPIDPAAFAPPKAPALEGPTAPNRELVRSERVGVGRLNGPEDVALDEEGRIYAGTADGKIMRVTPGADGGERVEPFAVTGGRPLGIHFDGAGNLVVAAGSRGLLSVDTEGGISVLATEAEGVPLRFAEDVDIASDGTIYFSDGSTRNALENHQFDLLESRPTGRLMRYDPEAGRVEVLLRELYFANGVALSRDEDFVLVNETGGYRITRYWIRGPKAGTSDIFIDNLPGFPDGIAADRKGTFWVALYTVRNRALDLVHPFPTIKAIMPLLPPSLSPKPRPYGLVIALDEGGRIVESLHDPEGETMKEVTSVQPHGEYLYMGSLHGDYLGRYRLRPGP